MESQICEVTHDVKVPFSPQMVIFTSLTGLSHDTGGWVWSGHVQLTMMGRSQHVDML